MGQQQLSTEAVSGERDSYPVSSGFFMSVFAVMRFAFGRSSLDEVIALRSAVVRSKTVIAELESEPRSGFSRSHFDPLE
jgi:hypothetical protein